MLVLGLGAGVLGGVAAGAFDALRALGGMLVLDTAQASLEAGGWRALVAPVAGGLLAGAVLQLGKLPRPMGMSRLMEHIQLRGGQVPLRDAVLTAVAAMIALGSGHSGGREAPVASLAGGLSHALGRRLQLSASEVRVLVAAAAAAAVAASFNTPLGSAVLAMEVLLGSFAARFFGPIVAATVAGTIVGQALLGERVAFHAPAFTLGHPAELLAYVLLGVITGALAAALAVGVRRADRWTEEHPASPMARGAVSGAVVGLLGALGLTGVMGTGYPLIERLLHEPRSLGVAMLGALLLGKFVTTLTLVASRIGPGLLSPILVLGATCGALVGLGVESWLPGVVSPGSFAIVAMGALAAATLRAPLSMVLVLFELTGDYAVVPTMLLASAVAMLVSEALGAGSLYDGLLANRGVHLDRDIPASLRALSVSDLMATSGHAIVGPTPSLDEVTAAFRDTRDNVVWSVDATGRYVGAIHVQDVLDAATQEASSASLFLDLPVLRADQPAGDAVSLLASLEVDEVAVVDAGGQMVGVLHERSLLGALHPSVAS